MNISLKGKKCTEVEGIIISLFEDKLEMKNPEINKMISHLKKSEKFEGKEGEVYNFTRELDGIIQDVVLLGLGKEEEISLEKIKVNMSKAYKRQKELKNKNIVVRMIGTDKLDMTEMAKTITISLMLSDYSFLKYKSKEKDNKDEVNVSISGCNIDNDKLEEIQEFINEGIDIANGIIIARNLVNEPANEMYPETLSEEAQKLADKYGFKTEVMGLEKIEELGMEAFLSVAKGSSKEPKLIVMRYFGDIDNRENVIGLVGKGLTFDAGGYSLKPTSGMVTMKSDMGGAAAVMGAMSTIAKRELKINVVAVIAACENMISGSAYKPGDIIGSMAGKTIEVLNTDAEGRLTLADAITYIIEKENVTQVIDLATLTGAALVALGETTTAVVSNDDVFCNELLAVTEYTGEKAWRLPTFDEYKELIKSDIADLKNVGGKNAGTITAGLFVGAFAKDTPWIHMDIAGTAWTDSARNYISKGGTGVPVNTLYEFAKGRSNRE